MDTDAVMSAVIAHFHLTVQCQPAHFSVSFVKRQSLTELSFRIVSLALIQQQSSLGSGIRSTFSNPITSNMEVPVLPSQPLLRPQRCLSFDQCRRIRWPGPLVRLGTVVRSIRSTRTSGQGLQTMARQAVHPGCLGNQIQAVSMLGLPVPYLIC
jgi:hypothetical protein